ncbi:MAG: ribose-phosphate pyrophosphokinase [Synergistaceae bacterium]|nr:ribose-phosphate pyrophosphokinase [Synergistaceae bacterium]
MASTSEIKIFSGSAHHDFAKRVCSELGIRLSVSKLYRFSDGEIGLSIEESVRGCDVYVIQPTSSPANDNLMELLVMVDALKRASASRINAVIPYFGYARQDRKSKPREAITSKLIANLITESGANRVITADLHAGQIQGFFDIPVDHLTGMQMLASYFHDLLENEINDNQIVVVSPDVGGVVRARKFAVSINADLAIVDKRRSYEVANFCEIMDIIGGVKDKIAILVDDIIDTAGSLCNAAKGITERGVKRIFACATHGVLSGPAIERLKDSNIEKVVITDTIPLTEAKMCEKITQLSIAPLFAEAIVRIHNERSISTLFDK